MERLHTARSPQRRGDYMMKLDLNYAYYAVPIHQESKKYLRFKFKETTYAYSSLVFLGVVLDTTCMSVAYSNS